MVQLTPPVQPGCLRQGQGQPGPVLSVLRNTRGFKRYQGEILSRLRAETDFICIFRDLVMGKIFSGGDSVARLRARVKTLQITQSKSVKYKQVLC